MSTEIKLTCENVGWLKCLLTMYRQMLEEIGDEDPDASFEMLHAVQEIHDFLKPQYPACTHCDTFPPNGGDGLCDLCRRPYVVPNDEVPY